MAMNGLQNLADILESGRNEIHVDADLSHQAFACIERMLDFVTQQKTGSYTRNDLIQEQRLFAGIGPA
jgi:quinolinate synthase